MGISQKEVTFVGKVFSGEQDVLSYLVSKGIITQQASEEYYEKVESGSNLDAVLDVYHVHNFPILEMIDYVAGEGFFLGYIVKTKVTEGTSLKKFEKEVAKGQANWLKIFGETAETETITQYS